MDWEQSFAALHIKLRIKKIKKEARLVIA